MEVLILITSLFLLIPINSLIVHGFYHATTYDGYEADEAAKKNTVKPKDMDWKNFLWPVRYYGIRLPRYVRKPVFECPQCMASVHGALPFTGFILIAGISPVYLATFPLYVLAVSFCNMLMGKWYDNGD